MGKNGGAHGPQSIKLVVQIDGGKIKIPTPEVMGVGMWSLTVQIPPPTKAPPRLTDLL